ncbi:uncharacterized protein LOC127706709 [Mytilus californianus]|uniref:uncharacterized protein LOC127706709 n=1 Tax=Mytilus californianus TaxID=6549 RepID=UPI0022452F3D|nr:uncharacterized protein LOC127706709 [Mytilus californianus]
MAINALDVVAVGNRLPPVAPRVRTYVDNQMNRRLRRVGMPYGYVAPRVEAPRCSRRLLGLEPEPVLVPVASLELPRNDQPEHFEAVVPRARLFSVMVPEAAIQIAAEVIIDEDDMVEVELAGEELSVLESTLEEEEVMELSVEASVLCGMDTTVEDPAYWFLEETVSFLPTEEETVVFEEVVDEDATTNHAEETVWYGPEEVEVPATPVTPYVVIGNDVGVPLDWEVIPAPVVEVAPVPEAAGSKRFGLSTT